MNGINISLFAVITIVKVT